MRDENVVSFTSFFKHVTLCRIRLCKTMDFENDDQILWRGLEYAVVGSYYVIQIIRYLCFAESYSAAESHI